MVITILLQKEMKPIRYQEIDLHLESTSLKGDLFMPVNPRALVIFSHGSGSSRFSGRNQKVAEYLQQHGFATFLFDLLTEEEGEYYPNRFNIPLLTDRLVRASEFLKQLEITRHFPFGYFGASTGAASALAAAVSLPYIRAVVSRGGRPDMAEDMLSRVNTPTLLIVGSLDKEVLELNRTALNIIPGSKQLEIILGATHLFEEPGMLNKVAYLANKWFTKHLTDVKSSLITSQNA